MAIPKPTIVPLTPIQQKDPHIEPVKLVNASGRYRVVSVVRRPLIKHDGGFVEKYGRREPTAKDHLARAKWLTILEGAEKFCGPKLGPSLSRCNHEDLSDATAAYRHFWDGNGKDRHINYEKYLQTDPSAVGLIDKIVDDFIAHTEIVGKNRTKFIVASTAYAIGGSGFGPTPLTANWRRTIGAHQLWVSATVNVSVSAGKIVYSAEMKVHMEDQYNFNPGSLDAFSNYKDDENGAFEMIGWAKQYMHHATIARSVTWTEGDGKSRVIITRPVPPPEKHESAVWGDE